MCQKQVPRTGKSNYRQVSNIRRTLIGNKIVDHFILNLTSGFNGLGKENCKMRQETFKFWDLVRFILKTLRYIPQYLWGVFTSALDTFVWHTSPCMLNDSTQRRHWVHWVWYPFQSRKSHIYHLKNKMEILYCWLDRPVFDQIWTLRHAWCCPCFKSNLFSGIEFFAFLLQFRSCLFLSEDLLGNNTSLV